MIVRDRSVWWLEDGVDGDDARRVEHTHFRFTKKHYFQEIGKVISESFG